MAEIIRDTPAGSETVPLEQATEQELRALIRAGSREAVREWLRRQRGQR